jgi:hypothetical protein
MRCRCSRAILPLLLGSVIGCGESDPRPVAVQSPEPEDRGPAPPERPVVEVTSAGVTVAEGRAAGGPATVRSGEPIPVRGELRVGKEGLLPSVATLAIVKNGMIYDSANAELTKAEDGGLTFEGKLDGPPAGEYQVRVSLGSKTVAEQPVRVGGG